MDKLFDITAFLLIMPGLWLMGHKKKSCFCVLTIASILMSYVAIVNNLYGLLAMQSVYITFNIKNYFLWKKDDNKKQTNRTK